MLSPVGLPPVGSLFPRYLQQVLKAQNIPLEQDQSYRKYLPDLHYRPQNHPHDYQSTQAIYLLIRYRYRYRSRIHHMPPAPPALSAAVVPLPHPAVSLKEPWSYEQGIHSPEYFHNQEHHEKFPQHQKLLEKVSFGHSQKRIECFFVTCLLKDFYSQ